MIAIPSKPITLVSSNVPSSNDKYDELLLSTQGYALNKMVKVTQDANYKYVGLVFKSIVDNNTADPLTGDIGSWVQIAHLEYDPARTYSVGDKVALDAEGNVYISMEDTNDTSPLGADSKWQFLYKVNKLAFNDYYLTTVTTVYNQDLVFEIEFSNADSISMFGVYGSDMVIEELDRKNGDAVLTTHTIKRVSTDDIIDFPSYLQYDGGDQSPNVVKNLIAQDTHKLRITLKSIASCGVHIAEIGTIAVGNRVKVGCTLYGLKITRVALQDPVYDKWGNVTFGNEDYVKVFTGDMMFETEFIDKLDDTIASLFNRPAVYIFDETETYNALSTFGIMETSSIDVHSAFSSGVPLRVKSFKQKRNNRDC